MATQAENREHLDTPRPGTRVVTDSTTTTFRNKNDRYSRQGAATTRRTTSAIADTRNRRITVSPRRIVEQKLIDSAEAYLPPAAQQAKNQLVKAATVAYDAFKTARGAVATAEIAIPEAYLYVPQFLFALLFIGTYYIEQDWWFVSWIIPGEELLGLAWVVIICIGIISMLIAAFAYNTLLLNSAILVSGFICLAGYFAPYVFIIPWVFVWMLIINMVNVLNTVEAIRE